MPGDDQVSIGVVGLGYRDPNLARNFHALWCAPRVMLEIGARRRSSPPAPS
jgi:hypothetical protein